MHPASSMAGSGSSRTHMSAAELKNAATSDMFDKLRERLPTVTGSSSSVQYFTAPDGLVLVSPAVDISHGACFYDVTWTSTHEEQ